MKGDLLYIIVSVCLVVEDNMENPRGKTIIKATLVLAATIVFAYLYSLLKRHDDMGREENLKISERHAVGERMREVYFSFACFILLLAGMPILR